MSNEIKVNPIDVDLVKAGTDDIPVLFDKCNSLQIANQTQYESVAVILKDVKSRYKELESQRKEITSPLDVAKKAVMDLYRKPLELLESAEKTIKKLMINYTDEQEKIALAKQRELQRLAEIEAEKERKKLEAKIARAEATGKVDKVADLQEQKEKSLALLRNVVRFTSKIGIEYFDRRSSSDKVKPFCAVVTYCVEYIAMCSRTNELKVFSTGRKDLIEKAIETLDNGGKAKFNALDKDFKDEKEFSAFLIYKLGTSHLSIEKTGEFNPETDRYEIYYELNLIPECCPNRLNYIMQKARKHSMTTYKLTAL